MNEVLEVPEGWKIEPLSNCSTITNSNVDKKYIDDELEIKLCNYMDVYVNEEIDKSVNFMTATATILEIEKFELKQNDVIITKDSESPDDIAIPTYIKKDLPNVLCGYHLTLLRPKMECNGKFLAIALQSSRYKKYFGALASGSTRFALSLGVISNTPILLPPLKEQQKIAKILSTLDSAIEASQKLIAKEKNIKKGLMHDLLTNGIDENGTIRSPKTNKYKESELGLIPVGWEAVQLRDVTKVQQGLQIPIAERYTRRGKNLYPYITIQSLKSENDFEYIMNPKKSVICTTDDVLMTRTGNTGSVITGVNGVFHNNFFFIDFDRKKINKDFLVYFLNSEKVQQEIQLRSGVTTIPDLNHGDFYSINFMKIDIVEQEAIVNILTAQDKKIETEEANLEKLKELKKGLMDDLLSGKVRVKV